MIKYRLFTISLLLLLVCTGLNAQDGMILFYKQTKVVNNWGMLVLGLWDVANMAIGVPAMLKNTGSAMYFHKTNVIRNSVNLSIAAFVLLQGLVVNINLFTNIELLAKHCTFERLFLINRRVCFMLEQQV